MKYYFCLVPKNENQPRNMGMTYTYEHRSNWIAVDGDEYCKYLTAGYMKGVDFTVYKGKCYMIMKTFLDLEENFVVMLCTESAYGSDMENVLRPKTDEDLKVVPSNVKK